MAGSPSEGIPENAEKPSLQGSTVGNENQEHAREDQPKPMDVDQEGEEQPGPRDEAALEADIAATDAELKEFFPHLPVSKVKKIARSDPEYMVTSNNAFVATAFATEIFIKALTEGMLVQSQLSGKSNKDLKTIRLTYNDLAECVSKKNEFLFLEDVVPRTKNLRSLVKQNRVRYTTTSTHAGPLPKGQTQLPFSKQDIDKSSESQRPVDVDNEKIDEEDDNGEEEDENEDENEDEIGAAERAKEDQVRSQMQEIEKMNHVTDLDREDSQAEHTDQEE